MILCLFRGWWNAVEPPNQWYHPIHLVDHFECCGKQMLFVAAQLSEPHSSAVAISYISSSDAAKCKHCHGFNADHNHWLKYIFIPSLTSVHCALCVAELLYHDHNLLLSSLHLSSHLFAQSSQVDSVDASCNCFNFVLVKFSSNCGTSSSMPIYFRLRDDIEMEMGNEITDAKTRMCR